MVSKGTAGAGFPRKLPRCYASGVSAMQQLPHAVHKNSQPFRCELDLVTDLQFEA